jgi:ribulose-phosphate 3-epimerase
MRYGTNKMIHICASLLAADYARLGEEVQRAEKAGVDSFHFDMMDGHYVPNLALTPDHLKALRSYSHLPFHAHLELDNPDDVLSNFASMQADMIIVQWNTLTDPLRTFEKIRSQNIKIGLGLTPDDALDNVSRFFREIDLLLLLGVYPGFGGQSIQPDTSEKIRSARKIIDEIDNRPAIAVDGGVKLENATDLVRAGADILIMGTALFQSTNMAETVKAIRESIVKSQRH